VPSRPPAREAFQVWLALLAALAVLQLVGLAIPLVHQIVGAAAVAAFLWVPLRLLERRGQDARDAGWRFDRLPLDVGLALLACALILPPFALAFSWFVDTLPSLPPSQARLLGPYVGRAHPLRLTLGADPWELLGRIGGNAAVAFAEEFFYRGYVTLRFEERWPPARRILGAPMGKAALLAAVLFALGHLLEPAPWRLFVFFPALVFAWLRARTGTIVGAAICHFVFNVTLLLLERAAFG
jgi:membrane protease YdiL (CAAX protease family)